MEKIRFGAIFYPQTHDDPERSARAADLGVSDIPTDYALAQTTGPLFHGQDQPRTYCLGSAENTKWDDADPRAMGLHIETAQDTGLEFFLIDTYQGTIDGKPHRELHRPIETFQGLDHRFGFGSLVVLGRPRVYLPLKLEGNFEEPGRYYDIGKKSAELIVDIHAQNYWRDSRYIEVDHRPYIAIMFPMGIHKQIVKDPSIAVNFVDALREHSIRRYNVDPHVAGVLVGTTSRRDSEKYLAAAGVDSLTGYAFLPDFDPTAPFLQDYEALLEKRITDWEEVVTNYPHIPFSPPSVVGWDATPRGTRQVLTDPVARWRAEAERIYPFHPIVKGQTPALFGRMVNESVKVIQKGKWTDPVGITCAWNEVGEGAALLDRVIEGEVDSSYRKELRRCIDRAHETR